MIMYVIKYRENKKKTQNSSIKIAMSKKCLTEDIQIRFAVCRPHVEQKLYQCPQNSIELLFTRREAPTLYEQSLACRRDWTTTVQYVFDISSRLKLAWQLKTNWNYCRCLVTGDINRLITSHLFDMQRLLFESYTASFCEL